MVKLCNMEIKRLLLIICLLFLLPVSIIAKTGKIKYNKCLRYEGELIDKVPCGAGSLFLIDHKNGKKILLRIPGNYSLIKNNSSGKEYYEMSFDVEESVIDIINGWSYNGSATLTIQGDMKNDTYDLSLNLKKGTLRNFDRTIELRTDDPIVFSCVTSDDLASIQMTPNLDNPIGVRIEDYKNYYLLRFNNLYDSRQEIVGTYTGNAKINNSGTLSLSLGSVFNEEGEYSIVPEGNTYRVAGLKCGTSVFSLDESELVLKHINVKIEGTEIQGDLKTHQIGNSLYSGVIKDGALNKRFEGLYTLIIDATEPKEYLKEVSFQNIKFVEGTLKIGDEIYMNGTWNEDNSFQGKYVNNDLKMELDSCYLGNDGKVKGIGQQRFDDGSIYYGTFDKGLRNGYGYLKYQDLPVINGMWVNDSLSYGNVSIPIADTDFQYEIHQITEGLVYSSHDINLGVAASVRELYDNLLSTSRQQFIENVLGKTDILKAKKYFIGNSFIASLDPDLLMDAIPEEEAENDSILETGTIYLELGFLSGNNAYERVFYVPNIPVDSVQFITNVNTPQDATTHSEENEIVPDYSPKLIFEESNYYRIIGDSLFLYQAGSFDVDLRLEISPKGQELSTNYPSGQSLVLIKRKKE